jgi:hypothetical protein
LHYFIINIILKLYHNKKIYLCMSPYPFYVKIHQSSCRFTFGRAVPWVYQVVSEYTPPPLR